MNETEPRARPAWNNAYARIAAVVATLVPVAICVGYVAFVGVDVPYYDQWALIPILERWFSGTWSVADLVAPHNGHPIVLPRLLMLGLASATGWNVVAEMALSCVMLMLSALVLQRLFVSNAAERWSSANLWRFLPILLVLFSLRQWENLLFGWQLTVFACLLCSLLAIERLERSRGVDRPLIVAIAAAIGASFSFASGLLVWPIGLLQLLLSRTRSWRAIAAWSASGAPVLGFGSIGIDSPVRGLVGLPQRFAYFLTAMGSPLATDRAAISADLPAGQGAAVVSALVGVALCGLLVWGAWSLSRSGALDSVVSWLLVSLFGIGTCVLLAATRAELGVIQALSSRYTTLSGLLVIGCYAVLDQAHRAGRPIARDLRNSLAALVVLAFVSATVSESVTGPHRRAYFESWASTLRGNQDLPETPLTGDRYSGAETQVMRAVLRKHELSVFRNAERGSARAESGIVTR